MTRLRACIVLLSLIPSVAWAQEPIPLDIGIGLDFVYQPADGMGFGAHLVINGRPFRHVSPLVDIGLRSDRVVVTNPGVLSAGNTGTQSLRRLTALAGVRIAPSRNTGPYAHLLVGLRPQYLAGRDGLSGGAYSTAKREFGSTALVFQPTGGMQFATSQTAAFRVEAGLVVGRNRPAEHFTVEPAGLLACHFSAVVVMFTGRR